MEDYRTRCSMQVKRLNLKIVREHNALDGMQDADFELNTYMVLQIIHRFRHVLSVPNAFDFFWNKPSKKFLFVPIQLSG
jgi:hypothetical protein